MLLHLTFFKLTNRINLQFKMTQIDSKMQEMVDMSYFIHIFNVSLFENLIDNNKTVFI